MKELFYFEMRNIMMPSPSIIEREPVTKPYLTGIAAVDCFLPIGCGQRELIIGDLNSGKTSLAITIVLNQQYYNNNINYE
jgi:F-type H+-transporting ATPase subunit alpha